MKRALGIVLLAVLLSVAAAPSAGAHEGNRRLGDRLAATWAKLLSEPVSDDYCLEVEGRKGTFLAPFGPLDETTLTCEVPRGTEVVLIPFTAECSTVEPPPFYGANEEELRECARSADEEFTVTMTLDDKPVRLKEVITDMTRVDLPENNILGVPAGPTDFVAHGWVKSFRNLRPGHYSFVMSVAGPDFSGVSTTIIIVN